MEKDKQLQKYLDGLLKGMVEEAKMVRKDYEKNPSPAEMSGSIHHIHENSPMLKERHERLITFKSSPKKNKNDKNK